MEKRELKQCGECYCMKNIRANFDYCDKCIFDPRDAVCNCRYSNKKHAKYCLAYTKWEKFTKP